MSRASLRMKQYRPMSADFSKMSSLSSVFGLQEANGKQNGSNGVFLINCEFFFFVIVGLQGLMLL